VRNARVGLDIGQAVLVSERHGMRTAVDVQLRQDPLDVSAHRLRADEELFGDLSLALTLREKTQDLALPDGQQGTDHLRLRFLGNPRRSLDASKDPAGPRKQLIVVERLHDVVVGANEEPGNPVRWRRSLARDEDDSELIAVLVAQLPADLLAAHVGKAHIENDQRRL
jgi:hypothetical protein